MGVRVLRTQVRAHQANSICERFGGSLRRECLDFLIPINEHHLKLILSLWIRHYNHGRPHISLGPGIPVPCQSLLPENANRHRIAAGRMIRHRAILGGPHHEYHLQEVAA